MTMMPKMTFTKAYAKYGAKLKNYNWACSAITRDGRSLVFSCLSHYLKRHHDGLKYMDNLDRWANGHGKNLAREHLQQAFAEKLPVRLVVAEGYESKDAKRKWKYRPSVRPGMIGKVTKFDGANFVIVFQEKGK
jgi:hypothetical protein